jgi:hypothetical protein
MNADILDHDERHLLGERATHPIEPSWGAPGASRLPGPPHDGPLGPVQRRFLG